MPDDATLPSISSTQEPPRGAYRCIFVGGMPRSGTTMLSALISTSEHTNPFAPEFHYLDAVMESLIFGIRQFDVTQSHFFRNRDKLIDHHFSLVRAILDEAWLALGRPERLVIKHCSLTILFPLLAQHLPSAQFVVIRRDPRDVLASELRVHRRDTGDDTAPLPEQLRTAIAQRYVSTYDAVIAGAQGVLRDRVIGIQLERLVQGDLGGLDTFLELEDIDVGRLWQRAVFDIRSFKRGRAWSPTWGQALTDARIGTFAGTLTAEAADWIRKVTLSTALAFEVLEHRQA